MGRPPKVPRREVISCFVKFMERLKTNDFPPASDDFWKQMSKELNNRWLPHSVYTHVRENKMGSLDAARKLCGISTPPPTSTKLEHDESVPALHKSDVSFEDDNSPFEPENVDPYLQDFHLLLPASRWDMIKPDDVLEPGEKKLKGGVWPYVISNAFFLRYNFPCAMIAKWSRVCIGEDGSFRLTFNAVCKSKTCGNVFIGTADKNPENGSLHLNIRARDTRNQNHEVVKRPLRGFERKEVGQKLLKQRPENYRRDLLHENMDFGDSVPPHIREGHVYRQTKMEAMKRLHGILPGDKRDQLTIIRDLSIDPQYSHTILDIGMNPFHLIYCTPEQVYIYKEYSRVVKGARVMSDATGSLVKKFYKAPGHLTGHIFLYVVTISFEQKTVPVYQVITERQDATFLIFWLGTWMRKCSLSPPRQAISDQERALLIAHCQIFNGCTLKQHVDNVFIWACDEIKKKTTAFPANTAIRIDVAHLMAAAARWDCFKDPHKFRVKRFYIRTIALLVDCQSVPEFQLVFLLTCLVALMPVNDYAIELPDATEPIPNCMIKVGKFRMTAEQARTSLEDYISLRGPNIDNLHEYSENEKLEISVNVDGLPEENSRGSKVTLTHQWIKHLISLVTPEKPESVPGKIDNGLYFPPIVRELERIGKEFPLWTSVALPTGIVPSHASTASQEGYFNEVKNRIFEGINLPVSCYRFLRDHLRDISSGDKEMGAKLKDFVHRSTAKSATSLSHGCHSKSPQQQNNGRRNQESPTHTKNSSNVHPEQVQNQRKEKMNETQKNGVGNEEKIPEEVVPDDVDEGRKFTEFHRDDVQNNQRISSNSEKRFFDDSDFISQMQWHGIINDKDKMQWQCGDGHVEESECSVGSFDTQAIYSDILGIESDALLGHIKAQFFTDIHTDGNNNDQSPGFVNQKPKDSDLGNEPLLQESPQFSSTLTECEHGPSQDTNAISIDKINILSRESIGSSKQSGKLRSTKRQTGYFAPYPQIKILNQKGTSNKNGNFLQNGLHCPVVKLKGMGISVINTCGFDSFVHILQYAGLDDDNYRHTLESSKSPLCKFVVEFINHGATTINLQRRCALLADHYHVQTPKNATTITPHILNAKDSLVNIWQAFYGEPVASRHTECSNIYCTIGRTTNVPYLIANHKTISEEGFTRLENAIEIRHTKDCKKFGCEGQIQVRLDCKETLFIELDVRNLKQNSQVWCRLRDIPVTLNLGKMYRLVGIIHFHELTEHFIAFCRRLQGSWIECDDLKMHKSPVTDNTAVLPFGALYSLI